MGFQTYITLIDDDADKKSVPDWEMSDELLNSAKSWILKRGCGLSFFLIVVWPALCLPMGVLPKAVYNFWSAVAFMWGWIAAIIIIGLPIWENRSTFLAVLTCNTGANDPENKGSKGTELVVATA